jgi:hypothetical protein
MLQLITQIFRTLAETLGLVRERNQEYNTPEMVDAKKAQLKNDQRDKAAKAVNEKDLDEIRRQLSE